MELIKGSHLLARLELVGKWRDEEAVFLVEKEEEAKTMKAVQKIHKVLNHKQKEQMYYAYSSAGKQDKETKKMIDEVVEKCAICKKNSRSKSKPLVAIPRAGDFNSVVALDLKKVGEKYILWMIFTCTKFVKGAVINDKQADTAMNTLQEERCMN